MFIAIINFIRVMFCTAMRYTPWPDIDNLPSSPSMLHAQSVYVARHVTEDGLNLTRHERQDSLDKVLPSSDRTLNCKI